VPDDFQHHDLRITGAGHHADVAGPARGAQDVPGRFQVAAADLGRTPQPNAADIVYRMTGSLPSLVWTQACLQPALTRCGVMTHQARAISRRRHGAQARQAASTTSPGAAIATSQAAPSR